MMKNKKRRYSKKMKMIAIMLLSVFTCQLLQPTVALALTTGPSQPEVQGFEPVGTTDMVDMFSGSFVYNIPLLDVEGYPVNISYHGGVTMEQEASWVGLGWNINPGCINRTVRGIPDDFNGDSVYKDFNIKTEKTLRVGVGYGMEFAGVGDPVFSASLNAGMNVNISNYKGVSCDFSIGGGINVAHCVSTGANIGVGSQTGASIDYNAGLSLSTTQEMNKDMAAGGSLNASIGGGYSSRTGMKDLNFSISASVSSNYKGEDGKGSGGSGSIGSMGANIPIGIKNFVPVITNSSTMSTIFGRIKLGGEAISLYYYGSVNAMFSQVSFNNDASRGSFGYLYLQNAGIDNASILDFTRDKDGMFNKSMQYLPVPNMTYDIYSLTGQGTGGIFRPFRNDFGNVYDPLTEDTSTSEGGEAEVGVGDLFEGGLDYTNTNTDISSGPWMKYQRSGTPKGFTSTSNGSVYENVYLKQGGELTLVNPAYFSAIGGKDPITPDAAMNLPLIKPGSDTQRDIRANLIYYHTAKEATVMGVGINPCIFNYTDPTFTSYGNPTVTTISRIGNGKFQRKKDQISEIVQVQRDGRKYVYGIPALNNVQREVTFSVDPAANPVNYGDGTVSFGGTDATNGNTRGRDNYYNSTVTPSYAHSYLLSAVLSADYVDVTGNGVTDDDLGSFTKFNYTRTDSDYRWITPYSNSANLATYNPGFWSDRLDDKGSFICGSREQWNLHSIETKNFIAEFYTSPRHDGQGITGKILNSTEGSIFNSNKSNPSLSYELDSIKLYNKHDRYVNAANAVPVKTIYFVYDYSLCAGIPNSDATGGKLTLRNIYFKYGNSQKSMISPYQFGYGPNPGYDLSAKDRWGNYKPNNVAFTNYEYPYVDQNNPANNTYAASWTLNSITLPSGGIIQANYESNDYAFVQDKPVNEMFLVQGLGNSPAYLNSSQLFISQNSPYLYAYFLRRPGNELPKLSFAQNYLGMNYQQNESNCMYFNFNVALTGANNTYEQIKGYANVTDIGICSNNTTYGYIKFQPISPTGGGANLNPVTYTALNVGRYNLPQIVFPGQNPDESNMKAILTGLKGAFTELLSMGQSPIINLVKKGGGRNVNLTKSYIRLQSVGLCKKGGGQRVKSLYFYDQWNVLAGGNDSTSFYGKQYIYTTVDSNYGTISTGVASYEPMIGGDENPLRQPVHYTVQSGSSWPPNDPVDLYQETPVGESLFPSAQVGYSHVLVESVHVGQGRSTTGVDQYDFYTAKDFPAKVIATAINTNSTNHYDFFSQQNLLTATQGYTLIFNDMHGKPKKVEHDVLNINSNTLQPITYQIFKYSQNGNNLNNNVNCLAYNGSNMVVQNQQLGVEEDITLDSRQKNEITNNSTFNANLNFFYIPPIEEILIPYGFPWSNEMQNEFQCAVVSKVVQQYGILDNVQSYKEGAITTFQNELYDPTTGQAVVTSTTNEFMDKEYTTNIPASWVYNGMSNAYTNIGYKDTGTISIGNYNIGTVNIINSNPLIAGDEVSVFYTDTSGHKQHTIAWVLGIVPTISCTGINVLPQFPLNTQGWVNGVILNNVSIQVISSGHKNMLNENVETYTSIDNPIDLSGALSSSISGVIDIKSKTFADSNTGIIPDYMVNADTINPYAIGERGEWRLLSDYIYETNRNYTSPSSRTSGLYSAHGLFSPAGGFVAPPCSTSPYNYLALDLSDPNWRAMRTITKWSPWGQEVENLDAVGNYSTAVFGYAQDLPIAVAANARQGDILTLGFENYNLLQANPDIMNYSYFYLDNSPSVPLYSPSPLYNMTQGPTFLVTNIGHTGMQSIFFTDTTHSGSTDPGFYNLTLPITSYGYNYPPNSFNTYFYSSGGGGLGGGYVRYSSTNEYLPFTLVPGKSYILNFWVYQSHSIGEEATAVTDYTINPNCGVMINSTTLYPLVKKTNLIDGWMQLEANFKVPAFSSSANMLLPTNFNIDDLRIYPSDANMKAFVYGPVNPNLYATNEKLMATLDENNFATMYEYDQEGNLVRVKKETSKGIMTISESRSGNPQKR